MKKSVVQFSSGQPALGKKPSNEFDCRKSMVQFAGEQPPSAVEKRPSAEAETRKSMVQFVGESPPMAVERKASSEVQAQVRKSILRHGSDSTRDSENRTSGPQPRKSCLAAKDPEKRASSEADGRKSVVQFAGEGPRLTLSMESQVSAGWASSGTEAQRDSERTVGSDSVVMASSLLSEMPTALTALEVSGKSSKAAAPQGSLARAPSRDLQIRVIQAELQSRRVDTEKTLASKLFGVGTLTEAWIFDHAAKNQRSMGFLWSLWLVGATLGMLAMSDVLPRAAIAASVLMLPLPCLTSLVLLTDLMLQVMMLFECYLMTGMQCYLMGSAALLLRDERIIFWACLAPTFLMATFVDAYPSKFRPRFAQFFFLGSGAVLMAWVLILFFGWVHPMKNNNWQVGQLEGSTVYSTVQLAGTLLAFCGRYLYSALMTPDSFVVIMSTVSTERIWVKVEREEVNGEWLATGKLVRCDKRSTRLELAPEEIGMTQATSMANGWGRSGGPRSLMASRSTAGNTQRHTQRRTQLQAANQALQEEHTQKREADSTSAIQTSSKDLCSGPEAPKLSSTGSVLAEVDEEAESSQRVSMRRGSTDEKQASSKVGRVYNALRQSCLSHHGDASREAPALPARASMGSLASRVHLPFCMDKARQPLSDLPPQRVTEYI